MSHALILCVRRRNSRSTDSAASSAGFEKNLPIESPFSTWQKRSLQVVSLGKSTASASWCCCRYDASVLSVVVRCSSIDRRIFYHPAAFGNEETGQV